MSVGPEQLRGPVRLDQNQDDIFAQQDGLHAVIQTPAFTQALTRAIAAYFGPIFEPDIVEAIKRFVAKGRRNDSRSFSVGTDPPTASDAGRVKILERDEWRIQAIIYNLGAATVYIGSRAVTPGGINDPNGGIPIATNTGFVLDSNVGELWAVSGTTKQDVRVLEVSGGL